jgi:protein-disulfide isomerase
MTLLRSFPSLVALAVALVAACASEPAPQPPPPAPPPPFNELGRADAPVTIVEFSDLQCHFCARYAIQTFPQLRRDYIDTGKVRYVVHDLPLAYHANALPAAIAARCAGEQGRYWEYREALFREQHRLAQEPYGELAAGLGLDAERFAACRNDPRPAAGIRADVNLAASRGIDSTPSFVLNRSGADRDSDTIIEGAKPHAVFKSRIDALLAPTN